LRKVKKMDTSKCILSIGFIQNTFTGFLHSKDLKRQRHCKYYPIRFPCVHFPHKCCRNTRNLAWLTGRVSREPCTVDRSRPISRRSFCLLSIAILFCKFSSRLARASELKSYDYDVTSTRGPSQWGSLDESYSLCSQGKLQSPIVLTKSNATVENVSQSPFRLTSRHSKFFARQEPSLQDIIVIQQSFPPPSMEGDASLIDQNGIPAPAASIENTVSKDTYTFDHIIFHLPSSEHALEGIRTDAEMNVVFRKSSSRNPNYIYVSTLLRIGDYNSLWNPIIQLYSSFSNEDLSKKPKIDFDIGDILPSLSTTSYFYYLGSGTFPPCTENVEWLIFTEPLSIGREQWNMIRCCQKVDNVRPLQASNDRNVVLYTNTDNLQ